MGMKSLYLTIDRIVVDGLPASGRHRFVSALQQRLRESAQKGISEEFGRDADKRIQSLSAGRLRPKATPDDAAQQVVNAIRQYLGADGGSGAFTGSRRGGGEGRGNV
jgi:hypothetical protein